MAVWVLALAYPALIAVLFYFAFLRPVQQERAKQRRELADLQVGDEV
ncbi:MAG: preprotein translocase subunit YajC, partial [Chloroflexi bacterium]|nr:preprotein translocase subunit YajC [Chloroflexota bacterium]